jgi:hypothetical protein
MTIMKKKIVKIISGGQTGADRGGLDAAIKLNIPHGGACPRKRIAEDGVIPEKYNMHELFSFSYAHRTEQNVIDSDMTLIFSFGFPGGGSALTVDLAAKHSKAYLIVDLNNEDKLIVEKIKERITGISLDEIILNIAGSRESTSPGIAERVSAIMIEVLK